MVPAARTAQFAGLSGLSDRILCFLTIQSPWLWSAKISHLELVHGHRGLGLSFLDEGSLVWGTRTAADQDGPYSADPPAKSCNVKI